MQAGDRRSGRRRALGRGDGALGRRVHSWAVVGAVSLCASIAALALSAAPASAALSYPFDTELAPAGGSFGQVEPNGVALADSSGKAYVGSEAAVDVFDLVTETELTPLNGGETPAGSFGAATVEVAANSQSGAVYVLDRSNGVVDQFNAAGSYVCQITGSATPSASECNGVAGSETPSGGFNEPSGLAVDQESGDIYVGDSNHAAIDVFSSSGAFLRAISLEPVAGELFASEPHGIAVDDVNGHVYMTNVLPAVVFVFTKAGEYLTTMDGSNTPEGSFGGVALLAVAADNASGRVFVSTGAQARVDVFAADGEFLPSRFGRAFAFPSAIAVDQEAHRVLVIDPFEAQRVLEIFGPAVVVPDPRTEGASAIGPTSATLNGSVNPAEVQLSECFFEWGPTAAYGEASPCVPAAASIPADSNSHPVEAEISGLQAGTSYHFRLVATNANGRNQGADEVLQTPPPPAISAVAAANLTPEAADLTAQINPEGFDTSYQFEYGTDSSYGTAVPFSPADAGAGAAPVAVAQHIAGLSAGTTYHFRLVATNANGTTTSSDHVFVFLAPEASAPCPANGALRTGPSAALPDCRAYEMVTPPQKNGALIGALTFGPVPDVSADGNGLILGADQCFGEVSACTAERFNSGTPYRFSRGASGWSASALSPSAEAFEVNTWWNYDANTETGLFSMPTERNGGDVFYAREPNGSFAPIGPLAPLSANPGFRAIEAVISLAMTPDLAHVVYSDDPVWPFSQSAPSRSLYEYVGRNNTEPLLVGVSGGPGSHDLISACGTDLGELNVLGSALSRDGRTVYFTAVGCPEGTGANASTAVPVEELFARLENGEAGAHTVAVSQPQALADGADDELCTTPSCRENIEDVANWRGAGFQRASEDGSKVFFLSPQQLTDDASQDPNPADSGYGSCEANTGANGCNLYLYDFARPSGHNLLDVSAGSLGPGGPQVQGVVAVSPDGSHVYFVAKGTLTATANSQGGQAQEGADNLYVFQRDGADPGGRLSFITDLSGEDQGNWQKANQLANVTPDGRFLVFTSRAALTPDVTRGDGAEQVFRYDAQSEALIRLSVGRQGFNDDGNGGAGDATIVPGLSGYRHAGARSDPTMSDDGSYVFFMSSVALTPGALESVRIGTNAHGEPDYAQNVYEWHAGKVSLISDGHDTGSQPAELCASASSVCLIGSDPSGENVFFGTADPLVAQDTDTQEDIYDARVNGGFAAPGGPAPCSGEGCKAPGTPAPPAPGAASATFSGPGNPRAHHRHKKRRKKQRHHKRQHGKRPSRQRNNGGQK